MDWFFLQAILIIKPGLYFDSREKSLLLPSPEAGNLFHHKKNGCEQAKKML